MVVNVTRTVIIFNQSHTNNPLTGVLLHNYKKASGGTWYCIAINVTQSL